MQRDLPFYENVEQALGRCIQELDGAKSVGNKLWGDKPIEDARVLLLNCLNPSRPEKLNYTQVMFIFQEAKNIGCYEPFIWYCAEIGFEAKPITKDEEKNNLAIALENIRKDMPRLMDRAERIQRNEKIRSI